MNRPSPFDHPETVPAGRELVLDPQGHGATVDGRHVTLTATEFGILRAMAQHPGHAFERDELQHHVESLRGAGERTIDSHVKNLRKKLGGGNGESDFIKTVHGYGYRFENGELGHWPQPSTSRSFCIGSAVLTMDYDGRRVFVGASEAELTGSEWDVLEYVMLFPGESLDNERISQQALGVGFAESGRLLASHIKNLRKKLKLGEYQPKWIATVHGVGYRFDGQPVQLGGAAETDAEDPRAEQRPDAPAGAAPEPERPREPERERQQEREAERLRRQKKRQEAARQLEEQRRRRAQEAREAEARRQEELRLQQEQEAREAEARHQEELRLQRERDRLQEEARRTEELRLQELGREAERRRAHVPEPAAPQPAPALDPTAQSLLDQLLELERFCDLESQRLNDPD